MHEHTCMHMHTLLHLHTHACTHTQVTMNSAANASNTFAREHESMSSAPGSATAESAGQLDHRTSQRTVPPSPNFRQNRHPFIIGVAGGTASGKTTVGLTCLSYGLTISIVYS